MAPSPTEQLVRESPAVLELAAGAKRSGSFALDLEFVSEARYIPELALVQIAYRDGEELIACAIDPFEADIAPFLELVADPNVTTVAHAARQDLALLAARFDVVGRGVVDTQIAAAFAGLGDQIGYARLVRHLCKATIDKGSQWTDWNRRPLSDKQLRYAVDDVRYLLPAWEKLCEQLEQRDRHSWVREESDRLCEIAATRRTPEEAYRSVGGWNALKAQSLGSLRALAAWREREALSSNKPPSWVLPDGAMVDLCRRQASTERELRRARGVGGATVKSYGADILAAIVDGAEAPYEQVAAEKPQLSELGQAYAQVILGILQAVCLNAGLPPRSAGSRADVEDLVRYVETGQGEEDVVLLRGWRHELVGRQALAWLRGECTLRTQSDKSPGIWLEPV